MTKKIKVFRDFMLAGLIGLIAAPGYSLARHADPSVEVGKVKVMSGGVQQFSVGTVPDIDDSFRIGQSSSPANGVNPFAVVVGTNGSVQFNPAPGGASTGSTTSVSIGRGYGAMFTLALSTATSAEIRNYTAKQLGEIVFNASENIVCVSTGILSAGEGGNK